MGGSSYYAKNKEIMNQKAKENYNKKKEDYKRRAWKNHLLRSYGLTEEQYAEMLDKQNGMCKICFRELTHFNKRLVNRRLIHVDHDHTTGEVRGILCSYCNKGLGAFMDSPGLLRVAAKYLEGKV